MKRKGIISMAAALAATSVMPAVPAFAAGVNYQPVAGTNCSFKKFLVMDAGDRTPAVSFSYTVAAGQARSADTADNAVMQVLPGVTPEKVTVSNSVFTSDQATQSALTEAAAGTPEIDVARTDRTNVKWVEAEGEKFATSSSTVDFSQVNFDEPGIYRYVITETASAANLAKGIIHDDDVERILDVYVTDNGSGTLVVSAYVLHKNEADVVINTNMGSADVAAQGAALSDKTDGFTNEYETKDLDFKKEVVGNQASRDKEFEFTLAIEGLTAGDKYTVSLADDSNANTNDGDALATSLTNSATIAANAGKTNVQELTADAQGKINQKFYLTHNEHIVVRGLPANAKYSVTENKEDYKSEAAAATGYDKAVTSGDGTIKDIAGADKVVKTSYKNTRDGIVPTGVLVSILPYAALAGAGVAGIVLTSKKKEEKDA